MNRQPEDELDALLSGGGDNPALSRALASLRDLGTGPAPAPSAELSALFGSNVVPLRRRRRRGALLGVVVAASMGLGVGTVAAVNPDFRHGLQDAVDGAVVLVQPGVQAEEPNDGGNSAGAPVPEATRDTGGPTAEVTTPAADAKDDPAADRADEAKKAAEEANDVPGEAAGGAGRTDDSASRTGIAPGNGQPVPGQAKKDEVAEQPEGKADDSKRAPQSVTVDPPGKAAQAPGQLKEKAKEAPGQLKEKAKEAPGQLKEKAKEAPGQLKEKAKEAPGQLKKSAGETTD
ncbi:hypothetical protein [Arthrobacter sp. USHLN218]|uniref:hypothetical protein n=1 Tax=Arthrobacter sp. USHLN218 TaxID=3081232 RepID=UPI003017BA8C